MVNVVKRGLMWLGLTGLLGGSSACSTYDLGGVIAAGSSVQERFEHSISMPDCASHPATIRTLQENYRFLVATDFHLRDQGDWDRLGGFLERAHTENFVAGLLLGDYMYEAGSSLERLRDSLNRRPEVTYLTAIGNHEVYKEGYQQAYRPVFGATCYAFRIESTDYSDLFIVLDSANGTLGVRQYDWLESLLAEERDKARHCFIGTHTHFFAPAGHVDLVSTYPVDEWMKLLDLFARYRVTAVFSGHSHVRDDTTVEGVRYVTVASWCEDAREWCQVTCQADGSWQIDFRSVD